MKHLTKKKIDELNDMAYQIRRMSLDMITYSQWGHIGGTFSQAEILACLYDHILRIVPDNPQWEDRDCFVLSKAHASPALYAALALKGFIDYDDIYTYCRIGGLEGHLDMLETPGVECSGGSLGLGLSYSAGVAYGLRLKEAFHRRVYCLLGDGELCEGQVWEAAMFAGHHKLDNLTAVVDYNKLMAKGFINELMALEPLADKWKAFGWNVIEVDGHDVEELCNAFHKVKYLESTGKPTCIIAHTVKGRGVEECEFNYKWHTHAPSVVKANAFLHELSCTYDKAKGNDLKSAANGGEGDLNYIIEEHEYEVR